MPKGYPVPEGWRGYIPRWCSWMLFATEDDYYEYFHEVEGL